MILSKHLSKFTYTNHTYMKPLLIAMLLAIGSFLFAQKNQTKTTDPFAGLDTVFTRVLKDRKAVGFAVAVVSKDKVIYSKGFGYRDLEKKLPVTNSPCSSFESVLPRRTLHCQLPA